MPRNYGRIATAVWRDPDFRELGTDARFTYLMLIAQPNVSAAGVLEVTVRRWAGNLGIEEAHVLDALNELAERAYIVADWDTEELLLRSFVRWDGGANNDLRRKAIKDAAGVVASVPLRASIAHELDRMSVPHGLSVAPQGPVESRRVVVTEGELIPQPLSATPEGEPEPFGDAEPPSMFCTKHPNGTEKPCGPCGTAKMRYAAWSKSSAGREKAAKTAAATAAAGCQLCGGSGWLELEDGRPAAKCRHEVRNAS
jgi:hypothetical protein